jgi:hypothetical protein
MMAVPLTIGTGVFWAFLLAEAIRYSFTLDENRTLIFFGVPCFVIYCVWCVKAVPKALRKAGYIE